jgi:hypothetical protein
MGNVKMKKQNKVTGVSICINGVNAPPLGGWG